MILPIIFILCQKMVEIIYSNIILFLIFETIYSSISSIDKVILFTDIIIFILYSFEL